MPIARVVAPCGMIEGFQHKDYRTFFGIPYAKEPTGDLRWKAPQPLPPFKKPFPAFSFRDKGMQIYESSDLYDREFYDDPSYERRMSEDCLSLNIWAPNHAHNAPVVVWIHGGAFDHGYASEKEFDGAAYAKRGIVFVSIQYRLGVFGFLAHPELSKEQGQSGNYGLLDQIAAIRWIKTNIADFGGNPDDITIMGQSAGAMSVQALASSPLIQDDIAKAIMQSGGAYKSSLLEPVSLKEAEAMGEEIFAALGIENLEQARAMDSDLLLEKATEYARRKQQEKPGLVFTPVIDGYVLDASLDELLEQGKIADIPYLLGSTKDDLGAIDADPDKSLFYQGALNFSRKLADLGKNPAYLYYFVRRLPGDHHGAFHSSELWYVMDTLERCWRDFEKEDRDLSQEMIESWADFIKTGNPNPTGTGEWKPALTREDVRIFDIRKEPGNYSDKPEESGRE